jgi:hypothetical protein
VVSERQITIVDETRIAVLAAALPHELRKLVRCTHREAGKQVFIGVRRECTVAIWLTRQRRIAVVEFLARALSHELRELVRTTDQHQQLVRTLLLVGRVRDCERQPPVEALPQLPERPTLCCR